MSREEQIGSVQSCNMHALLPLYLRYISKKNSIHRRTQKPVWLGIDFYEWVWVSVPSYKHFVRYSCHVCNIQDQIVGLYGKCMCLSHLPFDVCTQFKTLTQQVMLFCLQILRTPLLFVDYSFISRVASWIRFRHWRNGGYQYFSEDWVSGKG
jgi:hypothetical protein